MKLRPMFFIGLTLPMLGIPLLAQPDSQRALAAMSSTDEPARRREITEFVDSLGGKYRGEYTKEMVTVLEKAISDTDPEIQRQGFGGLNLLAHVVIWKEVARQEAELKGVQLDPEEATRNRYLSAYLASSPKIKGAARRALSDKKAEVRGFAASILGLGFPPDSEIENELVAHWNSETDARVRKPLLEGLAAGQYGSPKTVEVLVAALGDKRDSIRKIAARSLPKIPAHMALPIIMEKLSQKAAADRPQYAEAVVLFGSAAKPYAARIREISNSEVNPEAKEKLRGALTAMEKNK